MGALRPGCAEVLPSDDGDQNDKQRRCFWSFMDGMRWRGMTPVVPLLCWKLPCSLCSGSRFHGVFGAFDDGAVAGHCSASDAL